MRNRQPGTQHFRRGVVALVMMHHDTTADPARPCSGFFVIDIRAGFERGVREATENAMKCYREAAKARAAGDDGEAHALVEVAEQSLDVARDLLCRLEGL